MKKVFIGLLGVVTSTSFAFADPVLGVWQTQVDDGAYAHVDMHMCGANICGTIVRTFDANGEYQSENIGKDLVRNMSPKGENHYRGSVWRPSNDKIYVGKLDLDGDNLKLRGCVAGGLICAKQSWTRISN